VKTYKMGLWLGRAQRSDSLTERYINFFPVGINPYERVGNPVLDPEINNQLDLGIEWNKADQQIKVDLFAAYLQDFISSFIDPELSPRMPMSPGGRRFTNIEKAFKTGVELSYRQSLGMGLQQQFGLAYTYAQDLERDQALPEIAPLDIRYLLSGSCSAHLRAGKKCPSGPEFSVLISEKSRAALFAKNGIRCCESRFLTYICGVLRCRGTFFTDFSFFAQSNKIKTYLVS